MKIDQLFDNIRKWLSPPDPSTNLNKALGQRHQGSGQWFLKGEEYSSWNTEPRSFLWLHGIPGCGKTILSATVIEDLGKGKAGPQTSLYFYFDFNETQKQSLENAVRSLIYQLYRKSDPAKPHVDDLYSSCDGGERQPTIDSLCTTFRRMVKEAGEVWIVLDALDECPRRREQQSEGLACQLDEIERCLDYPALKKALVSLPKTLDETYARIF